MFSGSPGARLCFVPLDLSHPLLAGELRGHPVEKGEGDFGTPGKVTAELRSEIEVSEKVRFEVDHALERVRPSR